ncbi:actin-associated protein FAM107A [Aplochiton taeniatus]
MAASHAFKVEGGGGWAPEPSGLQGDRHVLECGGDRDLALDREQDEDLQQTLYLQQTPPPLTVGGEATGHLIRPRRLPHPVKASKSHQQLHRELRLTHKRGVCHEGKTELQRVLEKRNWEQGMKQRRKEEEQRNISPLHQELLKRQRRQEEAERELAQQQEGPEFIRVRERLRRTAPFAVGEKEA